MLSDPKGTGPEASLSDFPEETALFRDAIRKNLLDNEDWYRDLVNHSEDLLCTHDLQGRLITVNPAPARVLGYSVEELLKIPMREIIVPENRPLFDEYLQRIRRNGIDQGLMAVMTRSGTQRIWSYRNTLRTEGVTEPIVRGMAHDVTDKIHAEQALRTSNERLLKTTQQQKLVLEELSLFRALLDQSSDSIEVVDPETLRFLDVNEKACLDLCFSRAELLAMTIFDIDPQFTEYTRLGLERKLQESGMASMETLHRRKDGTTFPVEVNMRQVQLDRKYMIAVSRNITERKKTEEAVSILMRQLSEAKRRLTEEKLYFEQEIALEFKEIIGESKALKDVMELAAKVAASDSPVLLLGETGTGKELIARAIHNLSKRASSNFIKTNCAAIPSGLLESELFGNEKGAFTGAVSKKIGRFELADKGTLLLDEIGELPLSLQPKLLRVLQDHEFERLGGTQTLKVDFRLIAATNRDLAKCVRENEFRRDLYYRLSVFPIRVPSLRERPEDIPLLVQHFVHKFARRMNKSIASVAKRTMDTLQTWQWPGNIRELENFIERSVILTHGSVLVAPIAELTASENNRVTDESLDSVEREHILRVLRETRGRIGGPKGAAAKLGLKRTTLQSKLKQFGIDHHSV